MKLIHLNKAMTVEIYESSVTGSLNGSNPLTPGIEIGLNEFNLPDVSSNSYTTIFSVSRRIEDVGIIDIIDIDIVLDITYNGNGSFRYQISGDGGNTWVTITEGDFNKVVPTENIIRGAGVWISSIQPGNNKLQLRLQGRANVGTVNFGIWDSCFIAINYRKRAIL